MKTSGTGAALLTAANSSQPHRYLIETNPALTDLRQFLSSSYLLDGLGLDADTAWKRLGDGYYEQRLIQQAVVARTGQRFINGLTSDEAMFKYLMDNAIASQSALNLSVGVGLSGEQVAALTHDIVWMEDQVVRGEHMLVPVLYLAQANNRLAANGALTTGTLTSSDIKNKAEYDASSIGLSGGVGGTLGRDADNNIQAGAPGPTPASIDNVSANAPIALIASGDSSSKTRSGISGATVNITNEAGQRALTGESAAETVAGINTDVSSERNWPPLLRSRSRISRLRLMRGATRKPKRWARPSVRPMRW